MTSRIIIPTKIVDDSPIVTFPFLSQLGVSETISTAVVTATVYSGTDSSPSSVISGSASISGSNVNQLITAGVEGVIYLLECLITTSLGQTLSITTFLAVISDAT